MARILFTMTGVSKSVPQGGARNNLRNALNQITKNLEHPSTKSKCSPRAYGKHAFAKLKQVRTLCAATLVPTSAHLCSGGQVTRGQTLPERQSKPQT